MKLSKKVMLVALFEVIASVWYLLDVAKKKLKQKL
jgi:hypothetical protein